MDDWLANLVYSSYNFVAIFLIFGLFTLKSVVWFMPQSALYMLSGAVLPLYIAYILNFASILMQLSIGHILGEKLGAKRLEKKIEKSERLTKLFNKQKKISYHLCFAIRLIPAPLSLVNLYFGASRVKFMPYLMFSILGMLPYLIIHTFVGHTIMQIIVN